jgi:hypothetical protein
MVGRRNTERANPLSPDFLVTVVSASHGVHNSISKRAEAGLVLKRRGMPVIWSGAQPTTVD